MLQMYPPPYPLPGTRVRPLFHDRSLPQAIFSCRCRRSSGAVKSEAGTTLGRSPLLHAPHRSVVRAPIPFHAAGTEAPNWAVPIGSHCWHATGASCRMTSYQARPHPWVLPATTTTEFLNDLTLSGGTKRTDQHQRNYLHGRPIELQRRRPLCTIYEPRERAASRNPCIHAGSPFSGRPPWLARRSLRHPTPPDPPSTLNFHFTYSLVFCPCSETNTYHDESSTLVPPLAHHAMELRMGRPMRSRPGPCRLYGLGATEHQRRRRRSHPGFQHPHQRRLERWRNPHRLVRPHHRHREHHRLWRQHG